jgi:serine/threonine-protein kinase HipA
MADRLVVWLNDFRVAVVERDRKGKLRLSYTEEALATVPGGTPLLSLDLLLTAERYPNARTCAFLDGLLPEGEPRRAIAAELDVAASDVFALLAAFGKDCAGALVIQPEDEPPPITPTTRTAEPLSVDDLADLVANLRSAPLGVDRNVRLSLAGAQEKLLLTRMPDGSWRRPVRGTPSTHILKPEIERFENTVENEFFCMRLAQCLELDVAVADIILVDDRPVLVVERYDRVIDEAGSVTRIHQEDVCQALGLPPERKYEEDGGPTLARVANLLQDIAVRGSAETFHRALTLNVAIGNCAAHAKNFSLLHIESGALRLAPLYDLLSTRLYPLKDHLAMSVDSVLRVDRVTTDRIVNEASRWSMRRVRAEATVLDVLDRLPDAIAAAANQTPEVPDQLLAQVGCRVENLRASAPARLF